nr:probable protein S-acyltransferase 19 [Ipomoea trifida]
MVKSGGSAVGWSCQALFWEAMVRKHGWQLPAHTFQVVAITVFCLLVVAFYAFFSPFLGGHVWEYVLVGVYSPVALLVFILYVRCTAINPADPGIMSKFDSELLSNTSPKHELSAKNMSGKFEGLGGDANSSPSSVSRSSFGASHSVKRSQPEADRTDGRVVSSRRRSSSCCKIGGIFCALFIHEDCRKQDGGAEQEGITKQSLFDALLCLQLAIEAGTGVAVLVRCFVNKKNMEAEIVDRLGNGFSRAPFATVVAVCTAVSVLACVPLGELFFFHMILIRKGITTYEYVVAMRAAMSEAPGGASIDEEQGNILLSPSGSAMTGFSGGSSLGLQYKGAWCTPPRVFVDYNEEVAPQLEPGIVPSTVDPDAAGFEDKGNKASKRPVKISAWRLAKLDSSDAMKAAAKARASSNSFAPSQGSRDEYETGTQSVSSFSSPSHVHEAVTLSPLPQANNNFSYQNAGIIPEQARASLANNTRPRPLSYTSSDFDEKVVHRSGAADPLLLSAVAPPTSLLRDVKRTSVVWDQEAGRYVSVPVSAAEARGRSNPNAAASNSKWPIPLPREPSHPAPKPPVQQPEKLMYSGESIFFGGPLFRGPIKDSMKNERASGSGNGLERLQLNLPRESRFKRDGASHQLPVFAPGDLAPHCSSASGHKK